MGVRLGDVVYQPSTGRPAIDGARCAGYISATKWGLCGCPAGGPAGGGGGSHGFGAAIAAADKGGARPTGGAGGAGGSGSSGGTGSAGQGWREVGIDGWWGGSSVAISGGIVGLVGSVGGAWSFAGSRGGVGGDGARAATTSFVFVTAFVVATIGGGIQRLAV